jgi:hypothetical protein
MKTTSQNPSKIFASRGQVTAALERAAERARVIAEQTGTKLVVVPASRKVLLGSTLQVVTPE